MSSNNPYGGSQRPMPSQGLGSGPGQPLSPYGYPQQPPPGGPPTSSGYSFGPLSPDEQTTEWWSGAEPDPYGSPPPGSYVPGPGEPTPPRRGRAKILIIIGAAALAVILMAVLAVVVATRNGLVGNTGSKTQRQQTQSQGAAPQNAPRPSDAVMGYLQALAAGDAVAALSFAADPAPTGPLLTNEVLAKSSERADLSDIQVPDVDDQNATSVSATY